MSTLPCAACGQPVELAEPHLTVNRHVERHHRGAIVVLDAETIATLQGQAVVPFPPAPAAVSFLPVEVLGMTAAGKCTVPSEALTRALARLVRGDDRVAKGA